jgi:hypothetical protein
MSGGLGEVIIGADIGVKLVKALSIVLLVLSMGYNTLILN